MIAVAPFLIIGACSGEHDPTLRKKQPKNSYRKKGDSLLRLFSHLRQRSVFMMVLSLFFVITIPIYILGFGIYHWGYQTIEYETTSGLRSGLRDAQTTLESEVKRIRMLQYACLNDEDLFYTVNAEAIMTPYERSRALLTMQHRLDVMQESSSYIDDVKVCLLETNRMISSQHGVEILTEEWKPILFQKEDEAASHITYLDGKLYMCASYPTIAPDENATPLYTLILSLVPNEIRERLLGFSPYQNGSAALYNRSQNYLLSNGSQGALVEKIVADNLLLDRLASGETLSVTGDGGQYLMVGTWSSYLNMNFLSVVAQAEIYGGLWHYRTLFIAFFAVMFAVAIAFSSGSYYLIRKPMKRLVHSLKQVERGNFTVRISHGINDEYSYLYDSFNSMAATLQNLIEINYKQQLLTQQAEMRQLQTQINPHFLYNSFFTLYRMTKDEDYESVTEFLVYLSEYYRFITRDAHEEVPLRDEAKHAENYVHIQKIRFGRRIQISMESLPDTVQGKRVPRLILQPVLENAFEHGLKDVTENGLLNVRYRVEPNCLFIDVENNGASMSEKQIEELRYQLNATDDIREITGLINIHRRLRLKFGDLAGVSFSGGTQGGLKVTLIIPMEVKA